MGGGGVASWLDRGWDGDQTVGKWESGGLPEGFRCRSIAGIRGAAVLASLIASAGKIDRSCALIQQIDPTQLLPEEHEIFDHWRNRATLGVGLIGSLGGEVGWG